MVKSPASHPRPQALLKLACVVGARPNFIKMAALIAEFRRRPSFDVRLIHTGQHFSPEMSQAFFDDLELPAPDLNLEVSGGTGTFQTAEVMKRIEPVFLAQRPDLLVVVGDVNSTLAAALVAAKLGIPIAHVESGLRSFDRTMPEEINRVLTDAISDYLFVTEPDGVANLLSEGVPSQKIHLVGNVMIDTLLRFREKAARSRILEHLGLHAKQYAVATLHRPSNVDSLERLNALVGVFAQLAKRLPVVFPVHPRTRGRMETAGLSAPNLLLTAPLSYLEFLKLMSEARLVLTDSGGIQEETTILGVPCLTVRENTERPVTIERGTNRLVGTDPQRILEAAIEVLGANEMHATAPELWDGLAGARIANVLEQGAC
jgi:UDP-N-acetylglucosamine 2-epimerase (non-hydrolysing)